MNADRLCRLPAFKAIGQIFAFFSFIVHSTLDLRPLGEQFGQLTAIFFLNCPRNQKKLDNRTGKAARIVQFMEKSSFREGILDKKSRFSAQLSNDRRGGHISPGAGSRLTKNFAGQVHPTRHGFSPGIPIKGYHRRMLREHIPQHSASFFSAPGWESFQPPAMPPMALSVVKERSFTRRSVQLFHSWGVLAK